MWGTYRVIVNKNNKVAFPIFIKRNVCEEFIGKKTLDDIADYMNKDLEFLQDEENNQKINELFYAEDNKNISHIATAILYLESAMNLFNLSFDEILFYILVKWLDYSCYLKEEREAIEIYCLSEEEWEKMKAKLIKEGYRIAFEF